MCVCDLVLSWYLLFVSVCRACCLFVLFIFYSAVLYLCFRQIAFKSHSLLFEDELWCSFARLIGGRIRRKMGINCLLAGAASGMKFY